MDPGNALTALIALCAGAVLALAAALCRRGRSRRARFWARTYGLDHPSGYDYREITVLVVLPLLAQTLLVWGLVAGVLSVDVLRESGATVLIPIAVIAEVILWNVLLVATVYRDIMPLWVYPSWLRSERRRERDLIRSR
ncbi:hypothetical protein [Janibacter cremeus]|uniref:Uncharacterized protein n=1 Tax=Janibacter cremeus TaxID=1285192 RepID=A0A852VQ82_9MICO|nr:hypothetical protein [Janibacter cremeus]NYF96863.1 hypothetical protein [Janibacter cremeus]